MELTGVWPALATALTADETLDRPGLARLTEYCLQAGVYGVVALGSTGEFPAMTEAMRETITSAVVESVRERVPVIVGCGECGTKKTIRQVQALTGSGADAALVALPYYTRWTSPPCTATTKRSLTIRPCRSCSTTSLR